MQKKSDYRSTLNLPSTTFPQRGNLPIREPEIQKFWKESRIYEKLVNKNAGNPKYLLHDGPPYSNGDIHLGTALNKILKDFVVKFKGMTGHDAPYVPGWDNHGLPIERRVIEEWMERGDWREGARVTPEVRMALRRRCREVAAHFSEVQSQQFQRLGSFGAWDEPYLTMSSEVEANIVEAFSRLALSGYIYRGLRSLYWCKTCVTALAEAEVEYSDHKATSIWARFPLREDPVGVFDGYASERCYSLIWTTTPWTIPGNMAICVHPELDYVIVEVKGERYLLAEGRLTVTRDVLGWGEGAQTINRLKGSELNGIEFTHPLYDRPSPIVCGDHVTLEQGTGCVHTAPGHGPEDFAVCQREGIEVVCVVDEFGRFIDSAGERLAGMDLDVGNKLVLDWLKDIEGLIHTETTEHSYPHCWRCKNPIIWRATVQWFMNIDKDDHRGRCMAEIGKVQWIPEEGRERITAMVKNRPDWCLSRQRAWGVGLPIFYCGGCGVEIMTEETLGAVVELTRRDGSDAWFSQEPGDILPDGFSCPYCGGVEFTKEQDILDVWFDSGSTHLAVLESRPTLGWPADLYLEGSDQHRGWFNSSLMVGVGVKGKAPYRAVLTHGFVVDEDGRAMHKSAGNVISPFEIVDKYGADVLRLWVCSSNYTGDLRLGDTILKWLTDVYRRFRNTLRFCMSNLEGFDVSRDSPADADLLEIDRYILHRLQKVLTEASRYFDEFAFHRAFHVLFNFCDSELSAFYLDVVKDRLYCSAPDSRDRRSAQKTLFELANSLCRALFPIISHTAEEAWGHLPAFTGKTESVALAGWSFGCDSLIDDVLGKKWERLLKVREDVQRALEVAKREEIVTNPLEASIGLFVSQELASFLSSFEIPLNVPLNVSYVEVTVLDGSPPDGAIASKEFPELFVTAGLSVGGKCDRCWQRNVNVGESLAHPTLCGRCLAVVSGLEV